MNSHYLRLGVAAAALLTAALSGSAVQADNALSKAGKAVAYPFQKAAKNAGPSAKTAGKAVTKGAKDVQYGVRKNAANVSVNAHRVTNKNSVVRRKNGYRRHNTVVKPNGSLVRLHDHK